MSSLVQSPTKGAQNVASAENTEGQAAISGYENYLSGANTQLRSAIAGLGANPYFTAAQDMSPSGYQVNPQDTVTFGASGPGTVPGTTSAVQASPPIPTSPLSTTPPAAVTQAPPIAAQAGTKIGGVTPTRPIVIGTMPLAARGPQ